MIEPVADAPRIVAVIDIGKTNAKVVLVDRATGAELDSRTASIASRQDGPYPHLDVAGIWAFVCDALSDLNRAEPIGGIATASHGSAGAFLLAGYDGDGLALPILDYECAGPDEFSVEYETVRPPFEETLSPRLPGGLNLGAQIFWQERTFADAVRGAAGYVNYPQYWAWRLTGVAATEMCSMGAHSDLWNPRERHWSSLVERMGWEASLAPMRPAFDRLGTVRPALARHLGLDADVAVVCGIHDSNASLLPHLAESEPPFTVASTGTWTVLFAVGGSLDCLDPARDTLANVSAFGDPVPCARFMGGREFATLAGREPAEPTDADIDHVIAEGIMALPAFTSDVGPFPASEGRWTVPPEALTPGERTAAASLYLALVTAECMGLADAAGPTIVEGPFAANRTCCAALSAITGRGVIASGGTSGTSRGAAMLFGPGPAPTVAMHEPVPPLANDTFEGYAREWKCRAYGCTDAVRMDGPN